MRTGKQILLTQFCDPAAERADADPKISCYLPLPAPLVCKRGTAKDVTNLGRWGNGDAEVQLNTLEELPYVMGLVRQAFEKQMGDGALEA